MCTRIPYTLHRYIYIIVIIIITISTFFLFFLYFVLSNTNYEEENGTLNNAGRSSMVGICISVVRRVHVCGARTNVHIHTDGDAARVYRRVHVNEWAKAYVPPLHISIHLAI